MRAFALAALLAPAARAECSGLVEVTWSYLIKGAKGPTSLMGYAVNLTDAQTGDHLLVECGVGEDATLATVRNGGRQQAFYAVCEGGELSLRTTGDLGEHLSEQGAGESVSLFLTGDAADPDDLTDLTILRSACGFFDPGREFGDVYSLGDAVFSPGAEVENLDSLMVALTLSEQLDVPYGALDPLGFSGSAADVSDTLDYIDQVRALDSELLEGEKIPRAWIDGHPPPDYDMGGEEPPMAVEGKKPPQAVEGKKESEDIFA